MNEFCDRQAQEWLNSLRTLSIVRTAMGDLQQLDELMSCRLDSRTQDGGTVHHCDFWRQCDLTARKLIPALYHLFVDNQMPNPFKVVGFARREKSDDSWREEMKQGVEKLLPDEKSRSGKVGRFCCQFVLLPG